MLFTSGNVSTTYGNGVFVSLNGSATLSDDTITGNTDTRGTQVVDDGGAVYNGGTLTMTDDTVSNNGGTEGMFDGGAIFTAGGTSTTLTDDTFSGNVASDAGGAIFSAGSTTLNDDTLSANLVEFTELGNNAGGGVYNDSGTVSLNADTLVKNESGTGDGVFSNSGTTTNLAGTILNGEPGFECSITSGSTWNDDGHNLSDDGTCGFTKASSLANTNANLGALSSTAGRRRRSSPTREVPPSTQFRIPRPRGWVCPLSGYGPAGSGPPARNFVRHRFGGEAGRRRRCLQSSREGLESPGLLAAQRAERVEGGRLEREREHRDRSNGPKLGLSGPFSGATSVKFSGKDHAELAFTPPKGSNPVTGNFSVEAWVQASGNPLDAARTIVSSRTPKAEYSFDFSLVPGDLHADVGDGSVWLSNSFISYNWSIGTWYDMVVTVTGSTVTYYVDGNQVGSATLAGSPLLMDHKHFFQIGDSTRYTTGEFDGKIAQVSIYNQALTSAQVAAHWVAAG